MAKWIDDYDAAEVLDMNRNTLRRLVRSSDNPPPFVRPSSRTILLPPRCLVWVATASRGADLVFLGSAESRFSAPA
jgi:hypothetical protein